MAGELEGDRRILQPQPKDKRSKYKYNILCRIFFCWLDGLFFFGCRHDLEQPNLYAHPQEADSERLLKKFSKYWVQELERQGRGQKPRLWVAILKCFWLRFIVQAILWFFEIFLTVGQAVILGLLTRYFSLPCDVRNSAEETRNAYLYATGMVLLAFLIGLIHAHGFLMGQKIGMMCRIMMTSAIYKKVLTLNQVTIGEISVGHIVNLASNDVQRFDMGFFFIQTFWLGPLLAVTVTLIIYQQVGWVAVIPTAIVMLQIPFQTLLSTLFSKTRFKSAKKTDQRVRIMNEVIIGIRVIKMYAWEHAFKRVVTALRKHETKLIRLGGALRTSTTMFAFVGIQQLMLGLMFITFVATGNSLRAQQVFTSLALLSLLRRVGSVFLFRGSFLIYEANVAVQRIQKFLLLDEISPSFKNYLKRDEVNFNSQVAEEGYFRQESPWLPGNRKVKQDPLELTSYTARDTVTSAASVSINNLTASWKGEEGKTVLNRIAFDLNETAPLLTVVGPVGAGKSTLLQCLLGELAPVEGSVDIKGRISYTPQEPWVFTGSLRENILFGLPYQRERYNEVVKACALDKDIGALVNGDLTLVGERGVTLSGGQKARVNLARAVYHEADIYLLDDPLSAVDASVGKQLFEECIRGLLKNKLVVLVTHQVHFALQGDKILVLNKNGEVEICGSHSELFERKIDTRRLLGLIQEKKKEQDEFSHKESDGEDSKFEEGFGFQRMVSVDDPTSPCQKLAGTKDDQISISSEMSIDSVKHSSRTVVPHNSLAPPAEEKAHGSISTKTYIKFFTAGGNLLSLFIVSVFFLIGEAINIVTDWWLSDWASCFPTELNVTVINEMVNDTCFGEAEEMEFISLTCSLSNNSRLIIYSVLIISCILLNILRGILFYLVCNNAARVLHNRMFETILRTPVLFYDTNPSGRVLNRFSKDVGFLDDLLPQSFLEYLLLFLRFISIILVASVANPYILIPMPFIILIFLAIRWYFLKTSRSVKRLEALARSPVYSHISATLQGLSTIRTFGQQDIAIKHFHTFNNEHTQGWYLFLVMTRWFGIRLDYLSTCILIAVAFTSIPLISLTDSSLNPALLGLSLTYTVSLAGMFQYCVRQSTEVENLMISTERILEYSRLEQEASLETLPPSEKPPEDWPDKGELHMHDVAFRYSPELPLVLRNLSLSIRPSEKVGIVGRTGAGKSSLLSVLYRLAEPSGSITIDGVDTKTIGLHDLRRKMSIIPQDPVLFSGNMRYNLDPFDEYSDPQLWEVLEQVQLKEAVKELEGQLSGEVSEGGSNFSVGQKQLVCLARALLRKNKILILDEATANVDPKTDAIIQEAIRERFTECTVLTIAHRLNTIMDSDRILVMSDGQVKEFASPYRLLQNPESQLSKMVEKTGPEAAQKLRQMAEEARSRAHRKQSIL